MILLIYGDRFVVRSFDLGDATVTFVVICCCFVLYVTIPLLPFHLPVIVTAFVDLFTTLPFTFLSFRFSHICSVLLFIRSFDLTYCWFVCYVRRYVTLPILRLVVGIRAVIIPHTYAIVALHHVCWHCYVPLRFGYVADSRTGRWTLERYGHLLPRVCRALPVTIPYVTHVRYPPRVERCCDSDLRFVAISILLPICSGVDRWW